MLVLIKPNGAQTRYADDKWVYLGLCSMSYSLIKLRLELPEKTVDHFNNIIDRVNGNIPEQAVLRRNTGVIIVVDHTKWHTADPPQ